MLKSALRGIISAAGRAAAVRGSKQCKWERVIMIRGFFRLIGLLLLAFGFIFLVYDGARSIADQTLRLTRAGDFWNDVGQASQAAFRIAIEGAVPWLWPPIDAFILGQPIWAVLGVIGLLFMLVFRRPKPLIGYSRE
jgi:uncharacterized membrane protein